MSNYAPHRVLAASLVAALVPLSATADYEAESGYGGDSDASAYEVSYSGYPGNADSGSSSSLEAEPGDYLVIGKRRKEILLTLI